MLYIVTPKNHYYVGKPIYYSIFLKDELNLDDIKEYIDINNK